MPLELPATLVAPSDAALRELVTQQQCPACGATHTSLFRQCPDCTERVQASYLAKEQQRAEEELKRDRLDRWEALCAPDYRSTDWRGHPELSPICQWLAKTWWLPGPERDPRFGSQPGLGLYGPTGRGKTRCMYGILRRLHFTGIRCLAIEAIRFAEDALRADDLRAPWAVKGPAIDRLQAAKHVRVLLFDDLGKEQSAPGVAKAMHDLFEHRKAHRLPLLWTSERTGDELAQFLGANYADGITRRLRETCAIFHTEQSIPPAVE